MKYDYNEVSKRIRDKRIELGMTQEDLAMKCGYKGRSSINKIEMDSRNVQIERLVMIAEALECSPDYLIGWDDDEGSKPFGEDLDKYVDLLLRDKTEEMMIRIYRLLSPEDQESIRRLIERLAPREQA